MTAGGSVRDLPLGARIAAHGTQPAGAAGSGGSRPIWRPRESVDSHDRLSSGTCRFNLLENHMFRSSSLILMFALFAAVGCSTAPKTPEGKSDLEASAANALSQAKATDPSLATLLDQSAG